MKFDDTIYSRKIFLERNALHIRSIYNYIIYKRLYYKESSDTRDRRKAITALTFVSIDRRHLQIKMYFAHISLLGRH